MVTPSMMTVLGFGISLYDFRVARRCMSFDLSVALLIYLLAGLIWPFSWNIDVYF